MRSIDRESLVWIIRPYRHQLVIALHIRFTTLSHDQEVRAFVLLSTFKPVLSFGPSVSGLITQSYRLDAAHQLAMEELMVHVHQVFVHESVVALDHTGKVHRAVFAGRPFGYLRKRNPFGQLRHSREHKDQSICIAAGITANAPGGRGKLAAICEVRDLGEAP